MCGIAGIANLTSDAPNPSLRTLEKMCAVLAHRGPDEQRVEVKGGVGFGFRRLAIIDVEGGSQPIHNENGSVRVVCNGEIYNFRELRRMLQGKGHHFATRSDAEVLVHLWEEYGLGFTEFLNGMFAIVLHDVRTGRLVLVRDHFGIKPLYYAVAQGCLVFGSEVKALLASDIVGREMDVDALGQFLSWEYVPGKATLHKSIRKLEPAALLDVNLHTGDIQRHTYWEIGPSEPPGRRCMHEWEDCIDDTIRESTRRQLVSDVPLGAFLSGGVDSSLIVAAMGRAKTFSIGFDDPSYNELPWSRCVARHLKVDHHTDVIRPDVVGLFDHLMQFMDEPIGDVSVFPTFLVSRHARRDVTVALSGDGGDELFGGYETYLAQAKATSWSRVPALVRSGMVEPAVRAMPHSPRKKGLINKAKRFVEGLEHSQHLGHARWRLFMGHTLREALFTREAQVELLTPIEEHIADLYQAAGTRDACDRALYADVRSYLVDNCLVKVDRMSMANSLEVRVPFLDRSVVNLAFAMPSDLKVIGGRTKVLLKRVAARHVPASCVYRQKEGFSIPMKHWLKHQFRPLVEELLAPDRLRSEGLFNVQVVQRLKGEHMTGRANNSHLLWSLLVFQDWRRRWAS